MGIFSIFKRDKKEAAEVTTIAKGTKIQNGNLNLTCSLIIEGEYSGRIETTRKIRVKKGAVAEGSIKAENIIIEGVVEGEVDCNVIEVMDGAKISGEITVGSFIIGDGGIFEGVMKKK